MGDFKQRGGGFRGNGGGKPRFGGGGFQKKWGGDRGGNRGGDRGEVTMHSARCSNCGKDCEVPFKPTNGKPVFCKECFGGKDGGDNFDRAPRREFDRNERPPRRDFDRRHDSPRPSFGGNSNGGNDDLKKQVEMLTVKIERLIQSVENLNRTKPMEPKEASKKIETPEVKKEGIEKSLKSDKLIKETVKKASKKKPIKR